MNLRNIDDSQNSGPLSPPAGFQESPMSLLLPEALLATTCTTRQLGYMVGPKSLPYNPVFKFEVSE